MYQEYGPGGVSERDDGGDEESAGPDRPGGRGPVQDVWQGRGGACLSGESQKRSLSLRWVTKEELVSQVSHSFHRAVGESVWSYNNEQDHTHSGKPAILYSYVVCEFTGTHVTQSFYKEKDEAKDF